MMDADVLAPEGRMDKSAVVGQICDAVMNDRLGEAQRVAQERYPFTVVPATRRSFTQLEATRLFLRDGFIDRYSGQRLVFPGAIRLLSILLPTEFPYHPNWKQNVAHPIYWELMPTVDHVVPVARGGPDEAENWVTTSMVRNAAKAHWTLEELGWRLLPPGDVADWEGLIRWYVAYLDRYPEHRQLAYLQQWYRAARVAFGPEMTLSEQSKRP
jgi:hypothetical protein